MKTIKISKKQGSQQPGSSSRDSSHLTLKQIKQKLVKCILEASGQVEKLNKIVIPFREQNISTWANQSYQSQQQSSQNLFEQMMGDYTRILTQCFDIVVSSAIHSIKQGQEQVKMFKVKSSQRKKIKLLNQNEHKLNNYELLQEAKQRDLQIKQIFQLKERNKKLEKKVLLISNEFKSLKIGYEKQIDRYKVLLNSSIGNLMNNASDLGIRRVNTENSFKGRQGIQVISRSRQPIGSQVGTQVPERNPRIIKRFLSDNDLRLY